MSTYSETFLSHLLPPATLAGLLVPAVQVSSGKEIFRLVCQRCPLALCPSLTCAARVIIHSGSLGFFRSSFLRESKEKLDMKCFFYKTKNYLNITTVIISTKMYLSTHNGHDTILGIRPPRPTGHGSCPREARGGHT